MREAELYMFWSLQFLYQISLYFKDSILPFTNFQLGVKGIHLGEAKIQSLAKVIGSDWTSSNHFAFLSNA